MKFLLLVTTLFLSFANTSMAKDVQHNMRVDGITCPFCVATSAKALKQIDGVKEVGSDLKAGIIKVCADESVVFTEPQLTKLFIEKGFTFRGTESQESCDAT